MSEQKEKDEILTLARYRDFLGNFSEFNLEQDVANYFRTRVELENRQGKLADYGIITKLTSVLFCVLQDDRWETPETFEYCIKMVLEKAKYLLMKTIAVFDAADDEKREKLFYCAVFAGDQFEVKNTYKISNDLDWIVHNDEARYLLTSCLLQMIEDLASGKLAQNHKDLVLDKVNKTLKYILSFLKKHPDSLTPFDRFFLYRNEVYLNKTTQKPKVKTESKENNQDQQKQIVSVEEKDIKTLQSNNGCLSCFLYIAAVPLAFISAVFVATITHTNHHAHLWFLACFIWWEALIYTYLKAKKKKR